MEYRIRGPYNEMLYQEQSEDRAFIESLDLIEKKAVAVSPPSYDRSFYQLDGLDLMQCTGVTADGKKVYEMDAVLTTNSNGSHISLVEFGFNDIEEGSFLSGFKLSSIDMEDLTDTQLEYERVKYAGSRLDSGNFSGFEVLGNIYEDFDLYRLFFGSNLARWLGKGGIYRIVTRGKVLSRRYEDTGNAVIGIEYDSKTYTFHIPVDMKEYEAISGNIYDIINKQIDRITVND